MLKALGMDTTHRDATGKRGRVPHGAFEAVIERISKKYNLETSEINMRTILSRTKPGRKLRVKHRDTNSPMSGIEADLLTAILRRAALRQPVTCREGL
jgi:hypothetical protein